jgi:hypothetical protein
MKEKQTEKKEGKRERERKKEGWMGRVQL